MERSFIKRIKCILLVMVLILPMFPKVEANADEKTYINLYSDELVSEWIIDGDYLTYSTYAGQRSSKVSFGYQGVTISRCAPGEQRLANGAATEWVALSMRDGSLDKNDKRDIVTLDGRTYVNDRPSFRISRVYDKIVAAGYTEWADEFKKFFIDRLAGPGEECYIRLDFILETRYNYDDGSGARDESGIYLTDSKTLFDGEVYMNSPDVDGLNPNQIRNNAINPRTGRRPISWSSRTRQDFDNFFNIYLSYDGTANLGPDLVPGTPTTLYETKNYASGFDISQAIPSGETVNNVVSASCVNGSVNVLKVDPSYTYTATYAYKYQTKHMRLTYVGSTRHYNGSYNSSGTYQPGGGDYSRRQTGSHLDHGVLVPDYAYDYVGHYDTGNGDRNSSGTYVGPGNGEYEYQWDGTYDNHTLDNYTFSVDLTTSYQYIAGIDVSLIDSMTVYNNAFPSGSITYTDASLSNRNVSATLIMRSQSAINAGVEYQTIVSGTNLSSYNFAPNGYHYGFPASPAGIAQTIDLGVQNNDAAALTARSNDINSRYDSIANSVAGSTWSRNDQFSLADNGNNVTFMDQTKYYGAKVTYQKPGASSTTRTEGTLAASSSSAYATNAFDTWLTNNSAQRSTGSRAVQIPTTKANGDYPTGLSATWKGLFNGGATTTLSAGKNFSFADSIYNHVISGGVLSHHNGSDPDDGYPIRVHTPVLAPIKILFNDLSDAIEQTQLVPAQVNTSANYELLLDRKYYLFFDNDNWYSQLYGTPPGYTNIIDRYVEKKQVRFPFTVIYDGTVYPKTGSGYTQWIDVKAPADIAEDWTSGADVSNYESANHWQMMPFEIPSFADDCGAAGETKYVEVAVYAINHTGSDLDSDDDNAVDIVQENSYTSQYIATTRKQVQLSGWIYDFSVVGTNNQAMYTGAGLTSSKVYDKIGEISLANLKAELKSGSTNRLGTSNIRYLKDGTITTSLNLLQMLPMRTGQSFVFNNMGNVWKGQTFGFTVKTIADLNGNNDYLRLTPHFHYINAAGEILDFASGDFKMYLAEEQSGKLKITEYNPGDTSITGAEAVYLGQTMFEQSYYDSGDSFGNQQLGNWVANSVANENINNAAAGYLRTITAKEFMNRKVSSYTVNSIYIPATLRYVSGEYEQLQMNDGKVYDRATGATTLTTYWDIVSNYDATYEEQFKYSMQQWQSAYMIPTNTYIIDTRALGGSLFSIYNYIDAQSHFDFKTSSIVDHGNGQLIIGFDVLAYRNGTPYLTYGGGNNNMWLTETPPPLPTPDPEDKVIVDMKKSLEEYWIPAIQNIN